MGQSWRLATVCECVFPSPSVATLRSSPSRLNRSSSARIARTSRSVQNSGSETHPSSRNWRIWSSVNIIEPCSRDDRESGGVSASHYPPGGGFPPAVAETQDEHDDGHHHPVPARGPEGVGPDRRER